MLKKLFQIWRDTWMSPSLLFVSLCVMLWFGVFLALVFAPGEPDTKIVFCVGSGCLVFAFVCAGFELACAYKEELEEK